MGILRGNRVKFGIIAMVAILTLSIAGAAIAVAGGFGVPASCTLTVFGPGTLFIETFEDGDAAGWTIVDEGNISGPSNWQVIGQQFVQLSNIHGPTSSSTTNRISTFAVWDDPDAYAWSDYSATARLHATDNDGLGPQRPERGDARASVAAARLSVRVP